MQRDHYIIARIAIIEVKKVKVTGSRAFIVAKVKVD
jgi:hypothetical protein